MKKTLNKQNQKTIFDVALELYARIYQKQILIIINTYIHITYIRIRMMANTE